MYSVLYTVVIHDEEVCCSVVLALWLVCLWLVFYGITEWSVRSISGEDRVWYIDVYNSDVCSVVNVYHDHLKFCVVCINGRRYVCCSH